MQHKKLSVMKLNEGYAEAITLLHIKEMTGIVDDGVFGG